MNCTTGGEMLQDIGNRTDHYREGGVRKYVVFIGGMETHGV